MALRFIEGFEIHGNNTYLGRKYASMTGTPATYAPGRIGGRYCDLSFALLTTPTFTAQNTWVIGFGIYVTSVHAGCQIKIMSGATEQMRLRLDSIDAGATFNMNIQVGATVIATDLTSYARLTWHWFELKVTIHPTLGSYELRYNEVLKLSATAINTANSGSAGADNFTYGDTGGGQIGLDDIYICDNTGPDNNDFLGDCNVVGALPDADGDRVELTPSSGSAHFSLVDDPVTVPDNNDYVSSDTNGQVDLYGHAGFGTIVTTVKGLMTWFASRMATAGSRVLRAKLRDAANVEANGDSKVIASTTVREFGTVFENNPNTGVPWTEADLETTQFGVEVVS